MDQLIPVINKLQDVLSMVEIDDPIDLPQIVVVGSQSSGKSSVLESIVGRDFLPRGAGIVTRRPLILQLHHTRAHVGPTGEAQEWGEFLHLKGQRFYNFADIKAEIERETDRITGKNKGISPIPINLKIYSPNVLNLTLVDLPGLTKVPVGDQPKNIEELIRSMIVKFIEKPNSIILAVSAANTDLANSDALKLAREVDPQGQRTVGVLTKLDIMDKGTDAMDVLQGRVYPLRLGFIGVVLRSQYDINTNKAVGDARKAERQFFEQHPLYRSIAARCGVEYLAKSLSKTLLHHIRDAMPELKARVNGMLSQTNRDLEALGDPRLSQTKSALLLHVITKFNNQYCDTIEGRLAEYITDELYGGARINYIFEDVFGAFIKKMDPLGNLTTHEIQLTMSNATGPKSALFVPEEAFEQLCKRLIRSLEEPALQCIDAVYDELHQIVDSIQMPEMLRYQTLRERIREVVHVMLGQCRTPARRMIIDMIAMEQSYLNTSHPDFIGGGKAIQRILQIRAKRQINEQQVQSSASLGFDDNDWAIMNSATSSAVPAPAPPSMRGIPPELQAQYAAQYERERERERKKKEEEAAARLKMLQQREAEERARREKEKANQPMQSSQSPSSSSSSSGTGGFFSSLFGGRSSTDQKPSEMSSPQLVSSSSNRAAAQPQQGNKQQQSSQQSTQQQQMQQQNRMGQMPNTITTSSLNQDDFQTELIKILLDSYFSIVRNNIRDKVPKTIMHFMVNKSKQALQSELVKTLYKEDLMESLLEEAPDVAEKRTRCQQLLEVLQRASSILNEISEAPMQMILSLACKVLSSAALPWLGLRGLDLALEALEKEMPLKTGVTFLPRISGHLHTVSLSIPPMLPQHLSHVYEYIKPTLEALADDPACTLKEIVLRHTGLHFLGVPEPLKAYRWFTELLSRFKHLQAVSFPAHSPLWDLLEGTEPLERYYCSDSHDFVSSQLLNLETYGPVHLLGTVRFRLRGLPTPQLMKNFYLSRMWYTDVKRIAIGSIPISTCTILHVACAHAQKISLEIIDQLIRYANLADIDFRLPGVESANVTLLHVAIGCNHPALVEHLLSNYQPSLSVRAFDSILSTGLNAVELAACLQLPHMLELIFKHRPKISDAYSNAQAVYRLFYLAQKEGSTLRGDNIWYFSSDSQRTVKTEPGAVDRTLELLWQRFSPVFPILELRDDRYQLPLLHYAESAAALSFWQSKHGGALDFGSLSIQTPLETICQAYCSGKAQHSAVLALLEESIRTPPESAELIRILIPTLAVLNFRQVFPKTDEWAKFQESVWRNASREDLELVFSYFNYGFPTVGDVIGMFMSSVNLSLLEILREKRFRFRVSHSWYLIAALDRMMRRGASPQTRIESCFFLKMAAESPEKVGPNMYELFNYNALARVCLLLFEHRLTPSEQQAVAECLSAMTKYYLLGKWHRQIQNACRTMTPFTTAMSDLQAQAHTEIVNADLQLEAELGSDTTDIDPEDIQRLFQH